MTKGRLEAFSDGVIAIIITIMVLELRPPHGVDLADLRPLAPVFLSYVLSFTYLGIYWNNHHHMLHSVRQVKGAVLWANMHLLFWLSLVPFGTAWLGEQGMKGAPTMLYGIVLIGSAIAYTILARALIRADGPDSRVAKAIGSDSKGKVSIAIYATAVVSSLLWPPVACALYVLVALIWLVPDRRFERVAE